MKLANRALGIQESLTLAITAKAKKMKEDGINVIGFGAGEPDFNTPQYIIDAAVTALNKGMTKYTPSSGTLPLRQAIAAKLLKDNGLEYKPGQIVVSNGAKHSLYNAMLAIVDPGDEVILPAPYWLTYPELVGLCGGKCVVVETTPETDFKMTPAQLKQAITPKTKAIILNSPSNPTGSVYTKEELWELAKIIEDAEIYVISDEIYEKLVYGGSKHFSIAAYSPKLKEKTVVVNGMSKSYSMTGWRIGYLAANETLAKAIDNIQSHATSNANSIAQYASQIALTDSRGEAFLAEMVTTFDARRKLICGLLDEIKNIDHLTPYGAFYVMVNLSKIIGKSYKGNIITSAQRAAELMLDHKGLAVVPGEAFAAPNFLRLSYAVSTEDITEGIKRIKEFCDEVV